MTASLKSNPHFQYASRAAYELPHLLKNLPHTWHAQEALTDNEKQFADAAQSHASNATDLILRGLEALGDLMVDAATSENAVLTASTIAGLGELVTHLAVEVQYLRETEYRMTGLIDAPAPAPAKSKGGAK